MVETLIGKFENPERKKPEEIIGNIRGIFFAELQARSPEAHTYYDALHRVVELKAKEVLVTIAIEAEKTEQTAKNYSARIRAEKIYNDELSDAERQGNEDIIYRGSFNRLRVIANTLDEAYREEHPNPVGRTAFELSSLHEELAYHVFGDEK